MNISENKRIAGITVLFAIAFGGLMYYGFDCAGQADESMAKLDNIRNDYSGFEEADIQPSPENVKALRKICDEAKAKRQELETLMDGYKKVCAGDGVSMAATDYLVRIKQDRAEVKKKADAKKCNLAGNAASFGKEDRDFETAPESVRVAPLFFQHRVVSSLVNKLVDAGASAVESIYCAPLPEATYGEGDDWETEPMSFEIDFRVPRGVLASVLNDIMSSREYFMTITGMYVNNENSLPAMDAFTAPVAPAADPAAAPAGDAAADPAAAQAPVAVLKTGADSETVRVHLNIQVLYFNPKAH